MAHPNIASIDLKLAQLKNQRAQLLARECVAERKRSTRQAIIIGKWLMARKPELVTAISKVLERAQDRAAFDLPPHKDEADGDQQIKRRRLEIDGKLEAARKDLPGPSHQVENRDDGDDRRTGRLRTGRGLGQ